MTHATSNPPLLTVLLFGALEASGRGVPLKRPARRDTERLWQLLLVQRDQVRSREAVATILWPETTAQKARFNLRYHLHQLLNHLPKLPETQRWVVGDRDTIRWDPDAPMWLDIGAFDAYRTEGLAKATASPAEADGLLDRAVQLYRADLLLDVPDDWAVGPRDQLRDDVVGALDALIAIRERSGRIDGAIAAARRLLEIDPHRETSYRHLMRLCGRSGDRTAALEAFSACEAMLRREYGVAPSEETLELQAWLVGGANDEPLPASMEHRSAAAPPAGVNPTSAATTAAGASTPTSVPTDRLPFLVSRFVGRRHEVAEIAQALQHSRLVTLIGTGGVGKTRLALEAARAAGAHFGDQIAWVALDDVQDPAHVEMHVARAVMAQPPDDAEPRAALSQYYGARYALLVCDNCEHVLTDVADLVSALLHACPNLSVLATSRSPLQVEGEQRWAIRPLSLSPAGSVPVVIDDLTAVSEAAALFLDRVRSVQRDYQPLPSAVTAIADICARVDGIPLAIELAAARINLMTAEEIAARLAQDFSVLTLPAPNSRSRHATLEASIAWSYGLLGTLERRFLQMLTVFPRSFDLQAVTHVCVGDDVPADMGPNLVALLIDKSLVSVELSANRRRFRLLDPIRSYILSRLADARRDDGPLIAVAPAPSAAVDVASQGIDPTLAQRHADYFLADAERSEALLAREGSAQAEIHRLERDESNFLAAQEFYVRSGDLESARRLVGALWRFWYRRGFSRQQRDAMRSLIDTAGQQPVTVGQAKTQMAIGATSYRVGEHAAAQQAFVEAAAAFEQLGMAADRGHALVQLATAYMADGNLALAQHHLEQAVALRRFIGDDVALYGNLNSLAHLYWRQGRYADAWHTASELLAEASALAAPNFDLIRAHYALALICVSRAEYVAAEEHLHAALATANALGQGDSVASQDTLLGILYTLQGAYDKARRALRSSVDIDRGAGNKMRAARDMHNLGELALAQGDYPVARAMLGRSLEIKTRLGDTLGLIYTLLASATLAHETDDLPAAMRWVDEAAALVEPSGEASLLAWHQSVAARTALASEEFERAARLLAASLDFCVRSGERRRLAINLERTALLAIAVGRTDDARALAAAAVELRGTIGAPRTFGEAHDMAVAGLADRGLVDAAPPHDEAVALARAVLASASAVGDAVA
ncbi:MAG: BTAD domain-containing putative transcriptional regulator [Ardenticatenales bacterium]